MKKIICLIVSAFTFSAFAGISLDIDFKNTESGKVTKFKKKIETFLDETRTLQIPNSNKIVEIKVTDRIPVILTDGEKFDDQVLVDIKVIELSKNDRKVIASPKVITILGKEATMETYEDENRKNTIMSLKITPRKI